MTGLRDLKKAKTREAIVEAALALFEAKGFEAATIADIAAAAEVSPRTIFRYFASKEDLVFLGQEDENRRFIELALALPPGTDPIRGMIDVVTVLLTERQKNAAQFLRAARIIGSTPALLAHKGKLLQEIQRLVVEALLTLSQAPRFEVELMAAVFLAALDVAVSAWLVSGAKDVPHQELARVEDILRRAF